MKEFCRQHLPVLAIAVGPNYPQHNHLPHGDIKALNREKLVLMRDANIATPPDELP